jgi:hypothetical protein
MRVGASAKRLPGRTLEEHLTCIFVGNCAEVSREAWRNANARHPDVLAAQRRERARIRSEKRIRWGGRPISTTAA